MNGAAVGELCALPNHIAILAPSLWVLQQWIANLVVPASDKIINRSK